MNKINALLAQYGIAMDNPDFLFLRDNLVEMRKLGYTYKQMAAWLEERI